MSDQKGTNYLNAEKGIWSWLTTVDHKRIGIMYFVMIAVFFAAGGAYALAVRLELWNPGTQFMGQNAYNRAFTMHGAIMIFLFIIPSIPGVLGNFLLPLMLGTKDVAFPRLNLASWYVFVFGSIFCLYSLVAGGADTGWTFYTPYSSTYTDTPVISITMGAFILGFASIFTGINFIVTIHKMRAPGMTWFKMPLFCWGMYATALIQILATPVLGITLVLLVLEKVGVAAIFDPKNGGDPVLFQHFFWFYSHPAVYIMILPGMAIISELISVHSHRKIFGYKLIAFSSVAIALLGFLVWGHHMFVSGQSDYAAMVFSFLTFFIGIPSGIKVFNWMATMVRGQVSLNAPMLYALAFLILFTIGGLTGIFLGALGLDINLHDTYFVVAHFHYVMMGGTVIAFFGGIHHWWPKIFGVMYNSTAAVVAFVFVFVSFNVTFFNQFILGTLGMPRRYHDYAGGNWLQSQTDSFHFWHGFSSIGAMLLGIGFMIMVVYLLMSLVNGKKAGSNPWGALSMEWATPSPPPTHNFDTDPVLKHGPYDYDKVLPENI